MNEVKFFENEEFGIIRTVVIKGEPWFVGKDVAAALGYEKERNAIQKHVDVDDALKWGVEDSLGRIQDTTVINESGLYSLIFGSKLESAKKFKKWVTSEVLPSIRKIGAYIVDSKPDSYLIEDPVERAKRWIEEQEEKKAAEEKNKALEEKVIEMKPKTEYFDALVDSNLLTNFRDTAKELGYSQTEFTGWLLLRGYIYKDSKGMIKPYEAYRKQGLFAMRDFSNPRSGFSGVRTYVTVKGKNTFRLLMQVPDNK